MFILLAYDCKIWYCKYFIYVFEVFTFYTNCDEFTCYVLVFYVYVLELFCLYISSAKEVHHRTLTYWNKFIFILLKTDKKAILIKINTVIVIQYAALFKDRNVARNFRYS